MATVKTRIEALERSVGLGAGEPRRVYCVAGGSSDDDCEGFVRAQGYGFEDSRDLVIHIVGFEPCEDVLQPWYPQVTWCGPKPPEKWKVAA